MYAFKDWKESISTVELIHQEEETKLRLTVEHPQSYYMHDTALQAGNWAKLVHNEGMFGVLVHSCEARETSEIEYYPVAF